MKVRINGREEIIDEEMTILSLLNSKGSILPWLLLSIIMKFLIRKNGTVF